MAVKLDRTVCVRVANYIPINVDLPIKVLSELF